MKKLIMLAMVLGLLMSGCATNKNYIHESWVKEGASPYQLQKDYAECQGPLYAKTDMANYETDLGFCENEAEIRDRHKKTATQILVTASVIPYVCLLTAPAAIIVATSTPNSDICERCMKSRGYEKIGQKSAEECMKAKGYEFK